MWIKGNKFELEKIIEEGKLVKRKYDKLMTENKELLKMSKSAGIWKIIPAGAV
jgi:hypothetical protein